MRNKVKKASTSLKTSSMISTAAIEEIIENLKRHQYRDSTKRNYYGIWKTFNSFFIRLNEKPDSWESRLILFIAHLIHCNRKSSTIKSYVSAIKAVLNNIDVCIDEDRFILNSLTRACKLKNDSVTIRFPIQ